MTAESTVTEIDTGIKTETPEGIEFTLYSAGLLVRGASYAVDTLLQWAFIIAVEVFFESLRAESGRWFLYLFIFAVNWFYFFMFELFKRGQSPGKKLFGIRAVREDGSALDARGAFLRNILRFADTFLFLYQIAFSAIISTRGFKRLGDIVSGTLVVYSADSRVSLKPSALDDALPAINASQIEHPLTMEEKRAVLSFSKRAALLGRERGNEIVSKWTRSLRSNVLPDPRREPYEYVLGLAKALKSGAGVLCRAMPFIMLPFALFLASSCTRAEPVIDWWYMNLVYQKNEAGKIQPSLNFFVIASDTDGPDDLDELRLYNDEEGLMWQLTSETWTSIEDKDKTWIGSKSLTMPDGEAFPSGQYRIMIIDKAGERSDKKIGFDIPSDMPYRFPSFNIDDAGNYNISSSYPENYLLLYFSDGSYKGFTKITEANKSGNISALRLPQDVFGAALWAEDSNLSLGALTEQKKLRKE